MHSYPEQMLHYLPNGQALTVRQPRMQDAEALLSCFQQLVLETDLLLSSPLEAGGLSLLHEEKYLLNYVDVPQNLMLLAIIGQEIIGAVTLTQRVYQKQQHIGDIGIAIRKNYQNMGIGRRLLTAMFRWVEHHPLLEQIYCEVMVQNERAIHLYQHFGFEICGKLADAIKQDDGTYADLYMMNKKLNA